MPIPKPFKIDEASQHYHVDQPLSERHILSMANYLAQQRFKRGKALNDPQHTYAYLQTQLQHLEHEVFGMICLDQQHRVIGSQLLFRGTINQAQVYPRELVKQVLKVNAAAVILFHNHPSGQPTPSPSDIAITKTIQSTLDLIGVRTIDHVIVGTEGFVSLAQQGQL